MPGAMLCRMIKFLFSGNGSSEARYAKHWAYSPSARKFLLLERALSVTRSIPLSCKPSRSWWTPSEPATARCPRRESALGVGLPRRFGKSMPFSKMIPRTPVKRSSIDCLPHPVMESIKPGSGWIWPAMPIPTVFKPINSGTVASGLGH